MTYKLLDQTHITSKFIYIFYKAIGPNVSINRQDPYNNMGSYSAGLPQRNSFLGSPIPRNNQLVMGPSHVNSSGNWLNFKDKPKRRSYGDHEIFPQGARNMFSNLPNTFKKHLMKPQNKVDFDILQGTSYF